MLLEQMAKHAWMILFGLGNTLLMSTAVILCSTVLGIFFVYACSGTHARFWNAFLEGYLKFVNGTPLLVVLMVMYYVVFSFTGLPAIVVAIISFTFYMVPELTETFLTGIKSVPHGQYLAGISLGLTRKETIRHIIYPQAIGSIKPGFISKATMIVKETSLAGYILVPDLTFSVKEAMSSDGSALVPLLVISAIYFGICTLAATIINIALRPRRYAKS